MKNLFIPIYSKKEVLLFFPLFLANMKRSFNLVSAFGKEAIKTDNKKQFQKEVDVIATKEFKVKLNFSVFYDEKQKEEYLVKVNLIKEFPNESETINEYFFAPDHDITVNAMEFINFAFNVEQGSKEQTELFGKISEASVKFKSVIDFILGKDVKNFFDLETLSYECAFGSKPNVFNYVCDYNVDFNNQFSLLEYINVAQIEGKYSVRRKKIDLIINDTLEEHYTFSDFKRFVEFLEKL